jgi:hypothetical protein
MRVRVALMGRGPCRGNDVFLPLEGDTGTKSRLLGRMRRCPVLDNRIFGWTIRSRLLICKWRTNNENNPS